MRGTPMVLNHHIAEKIQGKVAGLVNQPISVVSPEGAVLASNDPLVEESVEVEKHPHAIDILYNSDVAGYVVLASQMPNQEEIAPLIRSIAELIVHQSALIEQLPQQEERLDKFVYDLLNSESDGDRMLIAEARLFDIELTGPRIAITIYIDDPILTGETRDEGDRELRISRYKFNINRALNSYYTSTRRNVIAYLGQNVFCILKDIDSTDSDLGENLEKFKKSINTIYGILKSELKVTATVGVGNYHPGVSGLRTSYQEAVSAIELGAQNWDKDRVYHIDDFGVVAPLLSGIDESNIYFSRELLEKLGQNGGVIETLETFFKNNMGLTQTAGELNIHRNTLVYRLDRIAETLGLDPRSFEDAVQIKLAILFNKFVGQK
ncbi:MAG TPA: helix-turn-helix domain-containing protein [Candidatus Dormibacteraeota bacterium]|nr:helix-turn-helix domain-containing protein [Candidatus Dormibacteraeota bacterium]